MSHSPEINHLAKALAAAQSSLSPAAKDAVNPHFRNHYASLGSVWDAAREVLGANGLSVVQTYAPTDGTRLDLVTTLLHESGQWISGTISMVPAKADPQGIGSAATYARRYSLASILGIVADEDDDGHDLTASANWLVLSKRYAASCLRSAPVMASKASSLPTLRGYSS